jgi:hypothetical protein
MMPRRRLAGFLLLVSVAQMILAPPIYACVAHRSVRHCQGATPAAMPEAIAVAPAAGPSLAPTHAPHHQHHTQDCCAVNDACRGGFVPTPITELGTAAARQTLASNTASAPTARRAAPEAPPPKR